MKENSKLNKAVKYGVFGLPLGVTIGHVISILISLRWGQGYYSPCVPEMAEVMGSEIGAVILQTVLCALLGGVLWGDFRNMAKRYLEHHETDGNILCDRFGGDDAGGVSLLLDGAQPERVSQLFCYLYRSICPDLADTVYACQA